MPSKSLRRNLNQLEEIFWNNLLTSTLIYQIKNYYLCFRWIKDLRVHEDFLGNYELPDIKSDTIVTVIKDSLIRMQLSLNDLRAEAYDGASNMFGKDTGVSVQIAAEQPKALSTHCQRHSLNFGISTTMTTQSK